MGYPNYRQKSYKSPYSLTLGPELLFELHQTLFLSSQAKLSTLYQPVNYNSEFSDVADYQWFKNSTPFPSRLVP